METLSERSMRRFDLTPDEFARVVTIMTDHGRGAVVRINGQTYDDFHAVPAAALASVRDVDVTSFWVNPDRAAFGRRHFVYFIGGTTGVRYFGDSTSPEVAGVCEALDAFFLARRGGPVARGASPAPGAAWPWLDGWPGAAAKLAIAAVLLLTLGFGIGRWSAVRWPLGDEITSVPSRDVPSTTADRPAMPLPASTNPG